MAGRWTAADIPNQTGRLAVVTGANSGLGLVTSRELARAGASVVLAVRNVEKGERAAAEVGERARVEQLDLSDLQSVPWLLRRLWRPFRPSGAISRSTRRRRGGTCGSPPHRLLIWPCPATSRRVTRSGKPPVDSAQAVTVREGRRHVVNADR